jgi:hypothetical protein
LCVCMYNAYTLELELMYEWPPSTSKQRSASIKELVCDVSYLSVYIQYIHACFCFDANNKYYTATCTPRVSRYHMIHTHMITYTPARKRAV